MSVQDQIDHLIAQRAAEWFEVVRTGQAERFPEFIAWIAKSPQHLEEFLGVVSLAPSISQAIRAGALDRESLLRDVASSVTPLHEHTEGSRNESASPRRRPRFATIAAAAAGVAGLTLVGFYALMPAQRYSTATGEQRAVQLPDGSVLELNARSRVVVKFGDTQRAIELVSGDAVFKVARDANRPFRVRTDTALVEAVGTQFAVSAKIDGSSTVSVLEGKVRVTSVKVPGKNTGAALGIGAQARISSDGQLEYRKLPQPQDTVAWLRREVVFDRATLEEVVAEFNKYNRQRQFRIEGSSPQPHHYSGTFRLDDPESLTLMLSKEARLAIEMREGEIVIGQR